MRESGAEPNTGNSHVPASSSKPHEWPWRPLPTSEPLDDHEIAYLVVRIADGDEQVAGADSVLLLRMIRGCSTAQAEWLLAKQDHSAMLLLALRAAARRERETRKGLRIVHVLADVAGWSDTRAQQAIAIAVHAGFVTTRMEMARA